MQRSKIVPHEIRAQLKADGNVILLMQEPYRLEGKIPGLGAEFAIASRGSKQDPPMAAVGISSRNMTALEIAGLCTTHCVCVQIGDGDLRRQPVLPVDGKHRGRHTTTGGSTEAHQRQENHSRHRRKC